MLERLFHLRDRDTTVSREMLGLSTFLTLSYILFVQPAVLAGCGMDRDAVFMATCLASALATLLMGLLANYPIALAPAMGHNFYFAFTVCGAVTAGGLGFTWQQALAANFLSGAAFVLLSLFAIREKVMEGLPPSLAHGISVGIGLMITFLGLQWSGLVVGSPATLVQLGNLGSPSVLVSLLGLIVMSVLLAFRARGAILAGILVSTAAALLAGLTEFHGVIGAPPSIAPTAGRLDFGALFGGLPFERVLTVIFVLFFLDLFDTVGTLVGVAGQAGLMQGRRLPKAREAFLSDAIGTVAGASLGTSTITSYVESGAGVAAGARTGLANLCTAGLFLLAIFFAPLVAMVAAGYRPEHFTFYPTIAPAMILIGIFMMKNAALIAWDEPTESIPAFLTMLIIPFSFSITEGIAFGFIATSFLKLVTGRAGRVHWLIHLFAGLFLLRYILLR